MEHVQDEETEPYELSMTVICNYCGENGHMTNTCLKKRAQDRLACTCTFKLDEQPHAKESDIPRDCECTLF